MALGEAARKCQTLRRVGRRVDVNHQLGDWCCHEPTFRINLGGFILMHHPAVPIDLSQFNGAFNGALLALDIGYFRLPKPPPSLPWLTAPAIGLPAF